MSGCSGWQGVLQWGTGIEKARTTYIHKTTECDINLIYIVKVVTRTTKEHKSTTGYASILEGLARESKSETAENSNVSPEIKAQVYQWIEYAVLYVAPGSKDKHVAKQLLVDFNDRFSNKSYIVGHSITLADLALFYAISDLVVRCLILNY